MRHAWIAVALALPGLGWECRGYELTGRIEPPAALAVSLHGTSAPFEVSAFSELDGRFRFRKLAAGTYTLAIATATRGEALQTIDVSAGTVDTKGRLDIVVRIDGGRLENDGVRTPGATVSTTFLSVPDRALREYDAAHQCLSRGDTACAEGHLDRAVQIAPHFSAAWNQKGVLAYQTRRFAEAERCFRQALDADPEAFQPLVNLGGVLLNLNRPGQALPYNRQAVARRPNDALANSQLGLTYFDLNDPVAAEKYLRIAVSSDPRHFSHPQLVLAEIYLRRGDRANALAALRQFLELHPDSPQAVGVRKTVAELSSPPR